MSNSIPKTSLTSSVTSDLPEGDSKAITPTKTTAATKVTAGDSSKATADTKTTPGDSTKVTTTTNDAKSQANAAEKTAKEAADLVNNSPATRALDAGIGMVKVDGGFQYVGVAPARDKDAKTPGGLPISVENSVFIPISEVLFHNSVRVKNPGSNDYYYPQDGATSWYDVEFKGTKLIPDKASKDGIESRKAVVA